MSSVFSKFGVGFTAWKYATKVFSHEKKKRLIWQQIKSFWHASLNPFVAFDWFETINSPQYSEIFKSQPKMYLKPFRVYMNSEWNQKRKMKVILDTYKFIQSKGENFSKIATDYENRIVIPFKTKDESELRLVLGFQDLFRKEGELAFTLESDRVEGFISAIAFSFEEIADNNFVCRIGCIQGPKVSDENVVKINQKLLFGIRPKSFLVFAVQEFSRQIGMNAVFGVGQDVQAFKQKHAIHIPWLHTINFDYDKVWLEAGGEKTADKWFSLPLIPQRKNIEEIESKKRSAYRSRYAMLDFVAAEIEKTAKELCSEQ
jgi:hypothetical protein